MISRSGLVWPRLYTGLDLGHMRWNLVLDGGRPIADQFLACYQALTGIQ